MLVQPLAEQGDEGRVDEGGKHRADADAVPPPEDHDKGCGDGKHREVIDEFYLVRVPAEHAGGFGDDQLADLRRQRRAEEDRDRKGDQQAAGKKDCNAQRHGRIGVTAAEAEQPKVDRVPRDDRREKAEQILCAEAADGDAEDDQLKALPNVFRCALRIPRKNVPHIEVDDITGGCYHRKPEACLCAERNTQRTEQHGDRPADLVHFTDLFHVRMPLFFLSAARTQERKSPRSQSSAWLHSRVS